MGLAYNNRALSRAVAGSDLVAALADSDQALKLLPLNLEVRDTRGFIYLKLGDPALALNEYNAALTIDPNRALSLYGRGLARIRMGRCRRQGRPGGGTHHQSGSRRQLRDLWAEVTLSAQCPAIGTVGQGIGVVVVADDGRAVGVVRAQLQDLGPRLAGQDIDRFELPGTPRDRSD